jgi:type IV pilus assembly protein PilE
MMTGSILCSLRRTGEHRSLGFTLMELMIVVAIIGILASIAYPSYINSVTRSNRAAATTCLSSFATHMERFYTTNLRYDRDTAGTAVALPALECSSAANTGRNYDYSFVGTPAATTFTVRAVPKGAQATRDSGCGTLSLTHTGTRAVTGAKGIAGCW